MDNLLSKHAPKVLDEVLGQAEIVRSLKQFVADPHNTAMLFHGDTGIGKTATAIALARELGCAVEEDRYGGLFDIPSGEMDGAEVKRVLRDLQVRPMFGSGWRVLVCNEADYMTKQAEAMWLDGLEHLPKQAVVIFTTNNHTKLTKRFRDRCEVFEFTSDTSKLRPAIRTLARKIWAAEIGAGQCPCIDTLGLPTLEGPESMHASFRLAIQQLSRMVRDARQNRAAYAGV